ncbi:MAG: potassium transporter TrkG [Spirochaetota bacterium]
MNQYRRSDAMYLLSFFVVVICIGTLLLSLPAAWPTAGPTAGPTDAPDHPLLVDRLFIATSAVCVTGLVTIDTADFSRFGQTVILMLIQIGGLGIISFTSLLLIVPGRRLPFRRLGTIRGFSIDGVEFDPIKIVRNIVVFTLLIEAVGAIGIYLALPAEATGLAEATGVAGESRVFTAVFHAVSAFCNAGFSVFPDSLEGFSGNAALLGIISFLIVTGGIGFIVLQDISRRLRGKRKTLSYHSKLILIVTTVLVLFGAASYLVLESSNTFAGMTAGDKLMNALFQAITPRTAGFNAVRQASLRQSSKLLTIILMFIGGAPGSIAGGIKLSTAYLILIVMLKRPDERGEINVFKRRLSAGTINAGVMYFLKALLILVVAAGALSLIEGPRGADASQLLFEVVSAFGTVGLSLGYTPQLSWAGKLVIIATMFAGRVGLIALAFPGRIRREAPFVYPEADILLG